MTLRAFDPNGTAFPPHRFPKGGQEIAGAGCRRAGRTSTTRVLLAALPLKNGEMRAISLVYTDPWSRTLNVLSAKAHIGLAVVRLIWPSLRVG